MTVEALKEEARRYEQREEWRKALELYAQAIAERGEEEEPDIALHNRVGDLHIRVGDLEGAVTHYEQAIGLYLAAELPNNAIAICRKVIRNDPARPDPFLRMGQIRASQGFMVDARQNFLTYAEMMQARGKTDEALRALEEFVGLAPEEVETGMFLAEQLLTREREEEALAQMATAYRTLMRKGEHERATDVLDRIREIAPARPLPTVDTPAPATEEAGTLTGFESTSLGDLTPPEPDADSAVAVSADPGDGEDEADEDRPTEVRETEDEAFELGTEREGETEGEEEEEGQLFELPGFRPELEEEEGHDAEEPVLLPTFGWGDEDQEDEEDGDPVELPLMSFDLEEDGSFEAADEPEEEDAAPSRAFEAALEATDALEETDRVADESDPGMEGRDGAADERDLVAGFRARVARDSRDAEGWGRLGEELFSLGEEEEGRDALERAHQAYADGGDPEKAMRVAQELLFRDPTRVELRQRVVEYAYQTNEPTLLIQAFLELADTLRAAGDHRKAQAAYQQVLSLDPQNERAQGMLEVSSPVPEPSVPEASGRVDDYVDLGALVLDEDREESTRWVVAAEDPSGDEAADFARMLSQFKEKVARNLSSDDAQSHYDLGTAYKEMGLLDEAIGEFQRALRARPHNLATFEMLGQCFLEQGEATAAIRTLDRGLQLPTQVEDDLLGVYYFLGKAHESVGNSTAAREFYEKIFSLDINFKDVTERLRALR